MDKTNPIDRMKSMYESYPTTRILILMNEKDPNRWKFSLLMNETIG
jgi:hypothetical protein